MRRHDLRIRSLALAFVIATTAAPILSAQCPVAAVRGLQPGTAEIRDTFEQAGQNQLGSDGPAYPKLKKGLAGTKTDATVPCIILKAIGYTESKWRQFKSSAGKTGATLISFDCGYGIMQITSGMKGGAGFDPKPVASQYRYNLGAGAKILIDKWNATASVGERDPDVAEDWYFAVWAYNGLSFINNPNNPRYDPNRVAFDGSQPRTRYPYQELVWGHAANSPGADFWTSAPLTLPDPTEIKNRPRASDRITRPSPAHGTGCTGAIAGPGSSDAASKGLLAGLTMWLLIALMIIALLIAVSLLYYWLKKRSQQNVSQE